MKIVSEELIKFKQFITDNNKHYVIQYIKNTGLEPIMIEAWGNIEKFFELIHECMVDWKKFKEFFNDRDAVLFKAGLDRGLARAVEKSALTEVLNENEES